MADPVDIRQATPGDLTAAIAWLADAGLPVADLTPEHMRDFLVAAIDGQPVGTVGLETFGDVGLLRSLVVDSTRRSAGIGAKLVARLEQTAAAKGVRELWLLTIDADPYFARLGYSVRERRDAPEPIRSTAEFSSLCPSDAVLMSKR